MKRSSSCSTLILTKKMMGRRMIVIVTTFIRVEPGSAAVRRDLLSHPS
jgi:hypothetical protein